jgi:hypothetical protein
LEWHKNLHNRRLGHARMHRRRFPDSSRVSSQLQGAPDYAVQTIVFAILSSMSSSSTSSLGTTGAPSPFSPELPPARSTNSGDPLEP